MNVSSDSTSSAWSSPARSAIDLLRGLRLSSTPTSPNWNDASTSATRLPSCAAATARFTATVVRPTPPFGLKTADNGGGLAALVARLRGRGHRRVSAELVLLARPDLADRGRQLVGAERLDQELPCAGEHRAAQVVRLALDGHHDHGGGRDVRGELLGRGDPVHAGHVDVHQDDVRPKLRRHLDRLGATGGSPDDLDVALEAEQLRQVIPGLRDVVDDQDLDAIGHRDGAVGYRYFLSGLGIGTWTISGGRTPYGVNERLQDDAAGLRGNAGIERRAQDDVQRAGGAGEEHHLGLCGGDGEDEQLGQPRDARSGTRCGLAIGPGGRRRDRRLDDADDLDVLEQQRQLDAQWVDAGDDRDRAVVQDLYHGERVAAQADQQVHGVAGVDQVADAGELVDLDGHRALAGGHGERHRAVLEVAGVDLRRLPRGPCGWSCPMACDGSPKTFTSRTFDRKGLRREHVRRHHGAERDVRQRHDGGQLGRRGVGPLFPVDALVPFPRNRTTTNVIAARKMPSSKTSRLVRRTN